MLAFGFPGGWEWFVILLIALLLFGSRLPMVMRSLGKSAREFKKGIEEAEEEEEEEQQTPSAADEEPTDHASSPAG